MGLNKNQLANFKKMLQSRRDAIAQEILQQSIEMQQEEVFFADSVDQASADTDKNIAVQMKNRNQGTLTQIDNALRRIDTGLFGNCDRCGESITEARLKAFPLTTLCIDCKAELESDQGRSPGKT